MPLSFFDAEYDAELGQLQEAVLRLVAALLSDPCARVKRCLLASIARLCALVGRARVNNELLPHLIAVLNDRDAQLRAAFFECVPAVALFAGKAAFAAFILPCVEQALSDVDEAVIQRGMPRR